jgi:hypothetical protein
MAEMRLAALCVLLAATPAMAESFAGFSGVDTPYLIDANRVCQPLVVHDGAASGNPRCDQAGADVVAKLSIKPPRVQRGDKAAFTASASGATLTITRADGDIAVTWTAPDPIDHVVDVYASELGDRVAVAYNVRRLGREVTAIVAFVLPKESAASSSPVGQRPVGSTSGAPTQATAAPTAAGPDDPRIAKAVGKAHRAGRAHQLADWQAVLALDAQHGEALYRIAAIEAQARHKDKALAALGELAKSTRPDAVEWRVEARFDKAFAQLRADPAFRTDVGLDRPPGTIYERVMGFGGQWEQTGTSCDKAEVHLQMHRDRTFQLEVKTSCEGQVYDTPFHGKWQIAGNQVVLVVPTAGEKLTANDAAACKFEKVGDEDALHCALGRDLEFQVLPARR